MSTPVENLPGPGSRTTLGRLCGLSPGEAERGERILWLSGDGFQAALFQLGALTRLNELGLLGQIGTVGAVSGGSIAAAVLATRIGWPFQGSCPDWDERVAAPLRALAGGDGEGAIPRRTFPGTTGEAALEERFARELLSAHGGEPSRGPRFVFGASGLKLSGISGDWVECMEWDIDATVPGGYEPELVRAAVAALPTGLVGIGEAEAALLENHGYLLAEAAAQAQGVGAAGDLVAALAPPRAEWMDAERVRAALGTDARRRRIKRLHLRRRNWERAG